MTHKNKLFENLIIYLIGPMEGNRLATQDFKHIQDGLVAGGIPLENILNPCVQEKEKTGY